MKRSLSGTEKRNLLERIQASVQAAGQAPVSRQDRFESEGSIILVNGSPMFFECLGRIFPTLHLLHSGISLKRVTVDMGAVPFVAKGADIMRPGIVSIDNSIGKDEPVCIVDERHGKPLAVGIALFSGAEIMAMSSGRAIKNIHYVGDKIWNYG